MEFPLAIIARPKVILCTRSRNASRSLDEPILDGIREANSRVEIIQAVDGQQLIQEATRHPDAAMALLECPARRRLGYEMEEMYRDWNAAGIAIPGILMVNSWHANAYIPNPRFREDLEEYMLGSRRVLKYVIRSVKEGPQEACVLAVNSGWTPVLTSNSTLREDVGRVARHFVGRA